MLINLTFINIEKNIYEVQMEIKINLTHLKSWLQKLKLDEISKL